ncbi:MAG: hypothetical protein ACI8T1_004334 [Verrucomicrobiales bacterium]|jgi:hypothetical protein
MVTPLSGDKHGQLDSAGLWIPWGETLLADTVSFSFSFSLSLSLSRSALDSLAQGLGHGADHFDGGCDGLESDRV